jgi:enamine deaminase RidA (YjgF/YER057c/UK114 family)
MNSRFLATVGLVIVLGQWPALAASASSSGMSFIESDAVTGSSLAVVVDDVPLAHTMQVLPFDAGGRLVGGDDAAKQTEQVLANLDQVLRRAKSNLENVAKLNIYLARDEDLPKVRAALAKFFSGPVKPAVAFVTGDLAEIGALVAMDAVAVSSLETKSVPLTRADEERSAEGRVSGIAPVAVLPVGPKLYVSGMADTNSLIPATRKTLEKLVAAIGHLGSPPADIVQLKIFLQPMSQVAAVRKEVADFFGGKAPPTVFVEWISANPVVEIELIAAAKGDPGGETNSVSYLTPPGTTDSKFYRRVAHVNRGKLIYVSGLYGTKSSDGTGQVREIFAALGDVTKQAGSDFEHLVKATYYVTDNDASNKLNELRPEYYHPQRPPAASKAKVRGVGVSGKTVTMDMIAVTK